MPTTRVDQHCYLLDLPVETLQRITNRLHGTQVLPAVRLTCKTLEHITFDRFTKNAFGVVKCCIFHEASWLSLKALLSRPSRITSKIRVIEFTTSFLGDISETTMQLAPNQPDSSQYSAQVRACWTYACSQGDAIVKPLNVALVARVLHDLKHILAQVVITCRMGDNQGPSFAHLSPDRDVFLTMVTTHHKIRSLTLSHYSLWELDDFFLHLRPELLQATSGLETFQLRHPDEGVSELPSVLYDFGPDKLEPIHTILRSSKRLISLKLCMTGFDLLHQTCSFVQTALEATAARDIHFLSLEDTDLEEKDLLKALSGWESSLEELTLGALFLTCVSGGWSAVLRLLSTMPKLRVLKVWELGKGSSVLPRVNLVSLSRFTKGSQTCLIEPETLSDEHVRCGRNYKGKAEVVSGLEELLAEPLPYQVVVT
jgi:hypothetical protein